MSEYKKGDLVIFRDWDDMAAEYGYDRFESIDCTFSFSRAMQHLCGEIATISSVTGKEVYLEFMHKEQGLDYDWVFQQT